MTSLSMWFEGSSSTAPQSPQWLRPARRMFLFLTVALLSALPQPQNAYAQSSTHYAYSSSGTGNITPGIVGIVDTSTHTFVGNIDVGEYPQSIVESPDGSTIYVANSQDNSLSYFATGTSSPTVNTITSANFHFPVGLTITPDGSKLLVTNEDASGGGCNNTVSIVSTPSKTVTNNLTVGNCPYGVAITPNGHTAFVVNGSDKTVSVIDLTQNPPVVKSGTGYPVSLGCTQNGYAIAITPDAKSALVACAQINGVAVVDLTQTPPVAKSGTGYPLAVTDPQFVSISPDGTLAYVSSPTGNTVDVVDLTQTPPVVKSGTGYPISVSGPEGIKFSQDGTTAYVGAGTDSVVVINTATNAKTNTILTANGTSTFNGGYGIVFAPAPPPSAYIPNYTTNNVSVISTGSQSVSSTISVGTGPIGSAVSPDGATAYVTNSGSGTVSIINTATSAVSSLTVGSSPHGVAFTPDSKYVYVANTGGDTVSMISTGSSPSVVATISFASGAQPLGVAISPDSSTVYVSNYGNNTVSYFPAEN